MVISANEARARLVSLIEQVHADQQSVEIPSETASVFLVPADEYRSLVETAYLTRSPRNAARLRESVAEVEARTGVGAGP